jgi:hypothetical protein
MSVADADYVLSGFRWNNPAHITYSIAPDGVFWDHGVNNLTAVFDAKFGAGRWERELARALATWEASANLNIALVSDSAHDENALGQAQGDPRFGDIRFGGYAFANTTTTLAQTYFPPPNGTTAAGDVEINTAMAFAIGSDYDLYSVMLHETGHSLGLEHASSPTEVMYANYAGVRAGLAPGDVAGIQAIYGSRQLDVFRAQGLGSDAGYPIDLSRALNSAGQAGLSGLSLQTIGDTEYFSIVAPAGASGGLHVMALAGGSSLLSPRVSVYDASGRLLDSQGNPSAWSDNITASASGVVPGQRYYVAVTGATSDVFAVGAYALTMAFDGVSPVRTPPTPVIPPPTPPAPGPSPATVAPPTSSAVAPDRFEPNDAPRTATSLGLVSQVYVGGLTLTSGSDTDYFVFRNTRVGFYMVSAAGTTLRVLDARGNIVAQGTDQVTVPIGRARSLLYIQVRSPSGGAVAGYNLGVAYTPPKPRAVIRHQMIAIAPPATAGTAPAAVVPSRLATLTHWRGGARRR